MTVTNSERLKRKLDFLYERYPETLMSALGIEIDEAAEDHVSASMPVDSRTRQPLGLLHGGASLALSETLASIGAWLNVDDATESIVGMEINANHVRPASQGRVTAHARPIYRGGRTQVWETMIYRDDGELICVSRCTLAHVPAAGER